MNLVIEWTYKTPKGTETVFRSEEMKAQMALLITEDLEKTGRTKSILFIDGFDTNWTVKELKRYFKEIETEPHNITVYFDGGFDRTTQTSGLGCVIYYEQSGKKFRLRKNAPSHDIPSNNEAEYAALYLCLQELELLGVHHLPVTFIGDSQVVLNQLDGEWPTYETALSSWADRIEQKIEVLGIQPTYEIVQRKLNAEADRLATQALNGVSITATSELERDK